MRVARRTGRSARRATTGSSACARRATSSRSSARPSRCKRVGPELDRASARSTRRRRRRSRCNAERQFYHCFSCKAGGDVFKFVQETEKVGFLEAVELLSRAGRDSDARAARRASGSKRAPLLEALEAAAAALRAVARRSGARARRARLSRAARASRARRMRELPARAARRRAGSTWCQRLRGAFADDVLVAGRARARGARADARRSTTGSATG